MILNQKSGYKNAKKAREGTEHMTLAGRALGREKVSGSTLKRTVVSTIKP